MTEVLETDADFLTTMFSAIPDKPETRLPSEYVQQVRYLNKDLTPFPGKFSLRYFPYFKEIIDCFAASSPVRKVFIMKGNQLGATTAVLESVMLYKIGCDPSSILFVLPNDEMAKNVMETKIDPMLDGAGLRGLIFSQSKKAAGSRNTGDTKTRKEFPGGYLKAVSAKSGTNFRNFSYKTILVDEADDMDGAIKDEGSLEQLIIARADAFPKSSKIYFASTPKIEQTSVINKLYLSGDQRRFFVPCKFCGEMQTLEWRIMSDAGIQTGGIVWENDDKFRPIPETVGYKCPHCGGIMKNYDKAQIVPKGEWRATADSSSPTTRSYHLTPLYNPPGMLSWEDIVCEYWVRAWNIEKNRVGDIQEYQTFLNTKQGRPFRIKNEQIKSEIAKTFSREYVCGRVPNLLATKLSGSPIRLVTAAVDVQQDCLYVDVKGWSERGVCWTLNFFKIEGDTSFLLSQCWQDLRQYIADTVFVGDDGKKYKIVYCFIDSGWRTQNVYEFAKSAPAGVFASKGKDWIENGATFELFNTKTLKEIGLPAAYWVNAGQIKDLISNSFKGNWRVGEYQGDWTPNFPNDLPDEYFQMFESEEKLIEYDQKTNRMRRMVWRQIPGRPNHALDTYVYNVAALTCLADTICRATGMDALNWEVFWKYAGQGVFVLKT